jgi:hypothetical protein
MKKISTTSKGYLFISKSLSLNRLKELYDSSINIEDYDIAELVNYFIENNLYDKLDDNFKPNDLKSVFNEINVQSLIDTLKYEVDESILLNKDDDKKLKEKVDNLKNFVDDYNSSLPGLLEKIGKIRDKKKEETKKNIKNNKYSADLIDNKRLRLLYDKYYQYEVNKLW